MKYQLSCVNCARTVGYLDVVKLRASKVGPGFVKAGKGLRCGHCTGKVVAEHA